MKKIVLAAMVALVQFPNLTYAIPAFPGAEGYGAETVGGRGGRVIEVTNLDDSGPGSFRDAVTASGPRYVVFGVSGIIDLQSNLDIHEPFLTIAGETSPGGVLLTGRRVMVNTHEVIVRHMRFRVGSHAIAGGADAETLDSLAIVGQYWSRDEAYNIIFDHCSTSWGVDETFSITGGVTNTTVQWCIVSEGLSHAGHPDGEHSKGLLISGKFVLPNSLSVHHNYIAHNVARNALIFSPEDVETRVDYVNNVSYNWKGGLAPMGQGPVQVNWVHNYARPGPESHAYSFEVTFEPRPPTLIPSPLLYVQGNLGSTRTSQTDDHWNVGVSWMNEALSSDWRRDTPWPAPPLTTTTMSDAYADEILADVGANRPVRDDVDARVIEDFMNGTGTFLDNVTFPDDFPTFATPAPPVDADGDFMADSWEMTEFGDLSESENGDDDGDGYENIEEYFHSLAGTPAARPPPTDGGVGTDGGTESDGGAGSDGGVAEDGGDAEDAGAALDAGDVPDSSGGCGCVVSSSRSVPVSLAGFALVVLARRRRHRCKPSAVGHS